MRSFRFTVGLAFSFLLLTAVISAQTASPFTTRLQPVVSGLTAPLLATNAKDGSKRLFIVQQGGIIKVVQPGSNTATDFLDITSRVVSGGERGLLGLAFHPQFATNGYFFVNYTRGGGGAGGETVIARFKTTNAANAVGDPNSERILLTISQPFTNHKGGMIEFRNDNGANNLYIGMGDGGSGNDPGNRAQNINELLGKFLRITPSVDANPPAPGYTVPADNPYVGAAGADEIYAIGLRNPFRWSFDRGGTRQLWAGDVGQSAREEVDIITLGGNYGWRITEGNICTPGVSPPNCTLPAGYVAPVFDYTRAGGRCSITGGYVYRGGLGSLPNGAYVYGDYCTGEILIWNNNQQTLLLDGNNFDLSSFGEDEDGELYVCGLSTGTIRKIVRAKASADFDGDFKTDISVFRPSNGVWYRLNSSNNSFTGIQFGLNGDIPTPADYDGDNITDIAVYRPSNGVWYYIKSSDNTFNGQQFGQANTDTPVVGDYDGDAKADFVVARSGTQPSAAITFFILQSSNGAFRAQQFGTTGTDRPVRGDFDGDGKSDIAVYSEAGGNWYVLQSSDNSFRSEQFGAGNFSDLPAAADYDGDGKTDKAVFRRSTGVWFIRRSFDGAVQGVQFGAGTDAPSPGDYDSDGRADIGVFRPSNGTWFYIRSSDGASTGVQFGQNGDLPVPPFAKQ